MLEDIRIYLMQRVYYMNKQAMMLEDTITPSIRRQLENLKIAQRYWQVVPSGFQEVEVRKADEAFCVNLHTKRCLCRKWEMSGIPCVHAVAGYLHMKMDPELGVSQSYSKNKWIEAYQYGIRPVLGSKTWMPTSFPKPLPPLERKMPGRPRKKRIRHPTENDNEISRVGRIMHCHKCWEAGHNKKSCKNPAKPKPPNFYQPTPAPEQASNTNETPEHFAEQMPVYKIDPVLPKQKAPPSGGSTSQSGTKRGASGSVSKVLKKSRLGVSTTKQDYITPEEHAFMMDQEALAETLRAEEAEQAAIREIWRQNEENDKAWEAYANEFSEPDFNQDFEDQIGIALTAEDSLVPAAIPTQHSQVKSKGKEHFTPADVELSTRAAANKKEAGQRKLQLNLL
ncbi:zinc finger, PMZ-type containing protein [Tanacetum coccineum]